ncbi:MAG: hypothetical protein R2838_09260 [Caldilineaceae bacterium]
MLINALVELRAQKEHLVKGMVVRSRRPSALQAMAENNFEITHVYGLTETYGSAVVCDWHAVDDLAIEDRRMKARQGVAYHMLEGFMVADLLTMEPVPPTARRWARSSCAAIS